MPPNSIERKLATIHLGVAVALGAPALGCTTTTSAPDNESTTQPISAAEAEKDANQLDRPPADLRPDELVRCLIDTPEGCTGCDQGDTCVYQQMKEYDCVYIVYGTKCDD